MKPDVPVAVRQLEESVWKAAVCLGHVSKCCFWDCSTRGNQNKLQPS